ncbi:MAG: methyltransferase domain-containing protein [Bacteroidota bacterium]
MDTKYLKLITTIDECGSLNKASQQLHLTPSALSHQLKNLEEQLGLAVFHRIDNQLYFTAAGKELRDKAKVILGDLERLETRMTELKTTQAARYIHGYSQREAQRLIDQANSVADYLHHDSIWAAGENVLEVGCGVGAQTVFIASQNPDTHFMAIDIASDSLEQAKEKIAELGLENVTFQQRDALQLSAKTDGVFDHVFVCYVLEHLPDPLRLLDQLKKVLRPGGSITVIEGDHGSTFFHPDHVAARKLIAAQVKLQAQRGGNANIGRQLFPLLQAANYHDIQVSPRQIYVDASKLELVDGFIKNTFTAMIQGIKEDVLNTKLATKAEWQTGIDGLLRTAEQDGTFSYTFFKAKAIG